MTVPPPPTPDEADRLEALRDLHVLDTPIEERFEQVTRLARELLRVPIAAISLVDSDRQWFKSIQGLSCTQTGRDISYCGHALLEPGVFVVPDGRKDARFADNPLVTEKGIVFYAGAPLYSANGKKIGMLCVNDHEPRDPTEQELGFLQDLAAIAEAELRQASPAQVALSAYTSDEERARLVDGVTRTWNRRGIEEIAHVALRQAADGECGAGIALVSIDGLAKARVDFGLEAGDEVMRTCAKRLLKAMRDHDAVGRFGDGEFMLVVNPCEAPTEGGGLVARVHRELTSAPIDVQGGSVSVGAGFRMRFVPKGVSETLESVLREAQSYMSAA